MKKVLMALTMVIGFAAMASAAADNVGTTCEEDPGRINAPGICASEQGCAITSFDYDNFGPGCNDGSYCEAGAKGDKHRALLTICDCIPNPFATIGVGDKMDIEMNILVDKGNGVKAKGANGVYWASPVADIPVRAFNDANEACELPCNEPIGDRAFKGDFVYVDATGDSTTLFPTKCDIESTAKVADSAVVTIKSASNFDDVGFEILQGDANDKNSTWWIDIPRIAVDGTVAQQGWKVWVEVKVSIDSLNNPAASNICSECICPAYIYLGELSCCDTAASNCQDTLIFPYLPKTAAYWYGMAITNTSSKAGNVTVTVYENDGDKATATMEVPAYSTKIVPNDALVVTADSTGSKVLGDGQSYAKAVTTGFAASGFGMMAKIADGTSSMGYLAEKAQCGNTCTCFH